MPTPPAAIASSSTVWDRVTDFASRHRNAIIYTTAAVTILVTAGGVWYYTTQRDTDSSSISGKQPKRERGQRKRNGRQGWTDEENQSDGTFLVLVFKLTGGEQKRTTVEEEKQEEEEPLPDVTEESLSVLPLEVSLLLIMPLKLIHKETKGICITV